MNFSEIERKSHDIHGVYVAVTGSMWMLRDLRPALFRENLALLLRDRFT